MPEIEDTKQQIPAIFLNESDTLFIATCIGWYESHSSFDRFEEIAANRIKDWIHEHYPAIAHDNWYWDKRDGLCDSHKEIV